jgi:hypothetical protein
MLKTIPTKASLLQASLVGFFLLVLLLPAYCDKNTSLSDPTEYVLNGTRFLIIVTVIFVISTLLFFYFKSATKTFMILNDRVEYKFHLKKQCFFLLSDICEMEWSSGRKFIRNSGGSATARGDSISIILKNGDVFHFDVSEYKNFDELRAWFLTYGRNSGIIKIEPINYRGRG